VRGCLPQEEGTEGAACILAAASPCFHTQPRHACFRHAYTASLDESVHSIIVHRHPSCPTWSAIEAALLGTSSSPSPYATPNPNPNNRVGFSGAELSNLVNEAALLAARRGADALSPELLDEARDKVMMGSPRALAQTDEARRLTAYHEGGHALVALLTPGANPIHKVRGVQGVGWGARVGGCAEGRAETRAAAVAGSRHPLLSLLEGLPCSQAPARPPSSPPTLAALTPSPSWPPPPAQATIMPRGHALGMVTQVPDADEYSRSRRQMVAYIDVCMGGKAAEELVFGEPAGAPAGGLGGCQHQPWRAEDGGARQPAQASKCTGRSPRSTQHGRSQPARQPLSFALTPGPPPPPPPCRRRLRDFWGHL
jgi:hypothetical protein